MNHFGVSSLSLAIALSCTLRLTADDTIRISDPEHRENGEVVHRVTCPWQSEETLMRVLQPSATAPDEKLRVLFLLPVEAGKGTRWGDGLQEIARRGLHEKHRLLCVAPTFAILPWYADHPTDKAVAQETYLLEAIVPAVDRLFPTSARPADRLLLGFSKSGWGAFSLLLRHPTRFGKAAAWDAPLMMETSGRFGSGPIFGTQDNFRAYQISSLLKVSKSRLGDAPRLFHLGYDNFREDHVRIEALLNELRIPHVYQDGPKRPHHWNSGWVPDAVNWLVRN